MIGRARSATARGATWRGGAARSSMTILVTALLVTACAGESAPRATVAVGAPAPSYAAEKADGTPIALADLKGEVVLLNIWATWCKPCRQEIPALETLHQRHRAAGLVVAGVSIDVDEDRQKVAEFAAALGASYAMWYDSDDRVSTTFLAIGVPASYLIGRDGTLRWRHVGPITAEDGALNAALKAALDEPRTD